jgi:hypothetical protein
MNIVKEINEVLALQDSNDREDGLERINDLFEYAQGLKDVEIVEGVQLLLAAILQERNAQAKRQLFRTIDKVVAHYDIGDSIDWDVLATSLSSLEKRDLVYVLDILGLSGQERYLSALTTYAHNFDSEIRTWALDAIEEVKYRVAHASGVQKEQFGEREQV